jgi:hypothetical protein
VAVGLLVLCVAPAGTSTALLAVLMIPGRARWRLGRAVADRAAAGQRPGKARRDGQRISQLNAALPLLATTVASLLLKPAQQRRQPPPTWPNAPPGRSTRRRPRHPLAPDAQRRAARPAERHKVKGNERKRLCLGGTPCSVSNSS